MTDDPKDPTSPIDPPDNVVEMKHHGGKKKNDKNLTTVASVRVAAQELYNTYRRQLIGDGTATKMTPDQVNALARVINLNRQLVVEADLEKRVEELERMTKGAKA